MTEKLQTLTDRINELVPENKKLKLGTLCKNKWTNPDNPYHIHQSYGKSKYKGVNHKGGKVEISTQPFRDGTDAVEVIGNPITLETVLMAMSRVSTDEHYIVNTIGRFFRDTDQGCMTVKPNGKYYTWQLGKSLDQQSEELWDLLIEELAKIENNDLLQR